MPYSERDEGNPSFALAALHSVLSDHINRARSFTAVPPPATIPTPREAQFALTSREKWVGPPLLRHKVVPSVLPPPAANDARKHQETLPDG